MMRSPHRLFPVVPLTLSEESRCESVRALGITGERQDEAPSLLKDEQDAAVVVVMRCLEVSVLPSLNGNAHNQQNQGVFGTG